MKESYMIYVSCEGNNNKFWHIQQEDSIVRVSWGGMGCASQNKQWDLGSTYGAEKEYDKKCKEKIKKGYEKVEAIGKAGDNSSKELTKHELADVALKEINVDSETTRDLIKFLTEQNIHQILENTTMKYNSVSGVFTTALGVVVGQNTIDKARNILVSVKSKDPNTDINDLTNQYFRLIPQDLGRARNRLHPDNVWKYNDHQAFLLKIQQQADLLDSLEASLKTVLTTPDSSDILNKVEKPRVFDCKLHLVDNKDVFDSINEKFKSTCKDMHYSSRYKLKNVYSVDISSVRNAWNNFGSKMDNIMDLFHGTSTANLLSILKRGLIVPGSDVSVVNGTLFGRGIYMATSSSKSLNYSSGGVWSSKTYDRCFMFIVKAALGKYYIPKNTYDGPFPKPGYDSIWAQADSGKTSGLHNDEIIVPRADQVNLEYLLEFNK